MKFKHIQLTVKCESVSNVAADIAVESVDRVDEHCIRSTIAEELVNAHQQNLKTIAFSDLGSIREGFPVVAVAKIIVQELTRHVRQFDEGPIEEVSICIEDKKIFEQVKKATQSYVTHLQENLGPGPYVTVDIIIEIDNGIVLIERSNPPFGWALPGGFVDYGESLEKAAVREAKEETNLDLEDLRQFHTYSIPGRDPRFQTISTVFAAKGVGTPRAGDDAQDLKVIPLNELLKHHYAFDHKKIIEEYLNDESK